MRTRPAQVRSDFSEGRWPLGTAHRPGSGPAPDRRVTPRGSCPSGLRRALWSRRTLQGAAFTEGRCAEACGPGLDRDAWNTPLLRVRSCLVSALGLAGSRSRSLLSVLHSRRLWEGASHSLSFGGEE